MLNLAESLLMKKARILIIIQLCLAFTALISLLGYPFLGGYYQTKSNLTLIESVMGNLENASSDFEKNKTRFNAHPDKDLIEAKYFSLKKGEDPFSLFRIPKLELLWMLLSIFVPIRLLLEKKEAQLFVWLLPLVTLAYAFNNQMNGLDPPNMDIFPKESLLSKEAFNHFLQTEYGGEFYFNIEQIKRLPSTNHLLWEKKSLLVLFLYFAWNCYFAIKINHLQKARHFTLSS